MCAADWAGLRLKHLEQIDLHRERAASARWVHHHSEHLVQISFEVREKHHGAADMPFKGLIDGFQVFVPRQELMPEMVCRDGRCGGDETFCGVLVDDAKKHGIHEVT